MEKPFLKKIKEYLFVKDFTVGKLGYCSHCKNDYINFYVLIFGSWFNKWFLERIEVVILAKDKVKRVNIIILLISIKKSFLLLFLNFLIL